MSKIIQITTKNQIITHNVPEGPLNLNELKYLIGNKCKNLDIIRPNKLYDNKIIPKSARIILDYDGHKHAHNQNLLATYFYNYSDWDIMGNVFIVNSNIKDNQYTYYGFDDDKAEEIFQFLQSAFDFTKLFM